MKNIFNKLKLTNMRRNLILGFIFFSAIFAIIFGSIFQIKGNGKLGIEYGGGAEYVVKIKNDSDNKEKANEIVNEVADSIYNRINNLDVNDVIVETEKSKDNFPQIRIKYPEVNDLEKRNIIEKEIIEKQNLVMTDVYGNYLFDKYGNFRSNVLASDPGKIIDDPEKVKWEASDGKIADTKTPIKESGGRVVFTKDGDYTIIIDVNRDKAIEFIKASRYISSLKTKKIVLWLDIGNLIEVAKSKWKTQWENSGKNIYNFVHVDNNPDYRLKEHQFDASKYLIHETENLDYILGGTSLVLSNNFSNQRATKIAEKINYGASNYKLDIVYSRFIKPEHGANAFDKILIAGIIIFALVLIFLIINYGILGVISSLSLALFSFFTILLFSFLKGEFSPIILATIIIGFGIAIDSTIINYEHFKNELNKDKPIPIAFKSSFKRNFSTIFDGNVSILIIAISLFFFGSRSLTSMSISLVVMIFSSFLIMMIFNNFLCFLVVNNTKMNQNKFFIPLPKAEQKIRQTISKIDFLKNKKWFMIFSGVIFAIASIVFITFASINGSFFGGFNSSIELKGGTILSLQNDEENKVIEKNKLSQIEKILEENGLSTEDEEKIYNSDNVLTRVLYKTKKEIDINNIKKEIDKISGIQFSVNSISNSVAKNLIKDIFIAIAIAIAMIVLYILIRFGWTYSLAAMIALIHDGLIITAVFIMARLEISPIFIIGLILAIVYSINDTITIFSSIKKRMIKFKNKEATKEEIKENVNKAINSSFKRSILTSLSTLLASLILLIFSDVSTFGFLIAISLGVLIGTYSSIFIATYLLIKFENMRMKMFKWRKKTNFWDTNEKTEQTFVGINDFNE